MRWISAGGRVLVLWTGLLWAGMAAAVDPLPLTGHTRPLTFDVASGSWLSLCPTADGRALVFDLLGDLYRLPADGGQAQPLTRGVGYDSQPQLSPDGDWLVFVSDRSGSDNLWISRADGSEPRPLTDHDHGGFVSPVWSVDGRGIFVTRRDQDSALRYYHRGGGEGVKLTLAGEPDDPLDGLGPAPSPDGRYLYLARPVDSSGPVEDFPVTQIFRYDLRDGGLLQITRSEGGGFRPRLSANGRWLAYGTRWRGRTGLRLRDLASGQDRWLHYPVQPDGQERYRTASRDLLPDYGFLPTDAGPAVVFNAGGAILRQPLADGASEPVPFTATVALEVGPDLDRDLGVPRGEVIATLAQNPAPSPDGRTLVASVLGRLYRKDLAGDGAPEPLTPEAMSAYRPVWSPDGRWIAFVSWSSAEQAGHVWRVRARGGRPERLSRRPAFYAELAYTAGGDALLALQGDGYLRNQNFSEFGGLAIPLRLVELPADGVSESAAAREIGEFESTVRDLHLAGPQGRVYLYDPGQGLLEIDRRSGAQRVVLVVQGPDVDSDPDEVPSAEGVRLSPDGERLLALDNDQLWAAPMPPLGATTLTLDLRKPAWPVTQLTNVGADSFGWSAGGDELHWGVGHHWYRRPWSSLTLQAPSAADGDGDDGEATDTVAATALWDPGVGPVEVREDHPAVISTAFAVRLPRHVPRGSLLLRGGRLIAMTGDSTAAMARVETRQDVLIVDDRIAAIGTDLVAPADARVVDVNGRWLLPGFIDTHAHWEFRVRDVLEPHNWSLAANLAYGVTSGLDVQTSHDDYFAYRDFVATGRSRGQRAFMTGPGVFAATDFQNYAAVEAYLRRYRDHYRTGNIKSYLVGNRRQRQWVVLAARKLGLLPTTEGGGDQKLDITHAIDGMHGNEHNLPDGPLFEDVVELYARTGTAYTPTLLVQYGGPSAREYWFTRSSPGASEKLQRFYPANRLAELTARRPIWLADSEFRFREGAAQAARIQRAGGLVGVGGHAELQGLGYHWEMWTYALGGMTPPEILRAATIDGARIIGRARDLGSIETGKLADLLVLDANPLDDIRNSTALRYIVQNGRLYDARTLDELWPEASPLPPFWWWDDDDRRHHPPPTAEQAVPP